MNPTDHAEGFVATLAAIGAFIGLGKLLNSSEPITARTLLGRAIVNAGIGAAAGSVLLWTTDLPTWAMYSVAAGLSSIGTSTLELILKRYLTGEKSPPVDGQ